MLESSARLLKLLSLLQTHRYWSGAELADRLEVTTRTLRRDIQRLRELGYPVQATQGTAGYQLGTGASLPPLLLDDDEAVAVAVALRTVASSAVTRIEETSLRSLAKLEQVLPPRLRHRVHTLQSATARVSASGPPVSPDTLMIIADACWRHEQLRIDYTTHSGNDIRRSVNPHSLVSWGRHWYLVAWDNDRHAWRTFRVDRLTPRTPTGPRFTPREPPDGDAVTYLSHQLSSRTWPYQATVTLHEPAQTIADRIWPGMGVIEALDGTSCLLHVGAPTPQDLVWMITSIDVEFTLTNGPPELSDALRTQAARCHNAVHPTPEHR